MKHAYSVSTAVATLIVLAMASACGTGSSSGASSVFKIGTDCDLTSSNAAVAAPIVGGIQAYAAYINKHGGVGGSTLQVIADDPQSTGTADVTKYTGVIKKHVEQDHVIAELVCPSSAVGANIPYFNDHQVPVFGIGSTDAWYASGANYQYIFSLLPLATSLASLSAAYLQKASTNHGGRLAFISSPSASGSSQGNWLKDNAGSYGFTLVDAEYPPLSQTDYASTSAKLYALKPDAIIFGGANPNQVHPILAGLRALGWKGVSASEASAFDDSDLKTEAGTGYVAVRASAVPQEEANSPDVKKLVDMGRTLKLPAYYLAGFGYIYGAVVGQILAAALTSCGSACTPQKLADALAKTKVDLGGAGGLAQSTPTRHWFLSNARPYAWDSSKALGIPLGDWISIAQPVKEYTGNVAS